MSARPLVELRSSAGCSDTPSACHLPVLRLSHTQPTKANTHCNREWGPFSCCRLRAVWESAQSSIFLHVMIHVGSLGGRTRVGLELVERLEVCCHVGTPHHAPHIACAGIVRSNHLRQKRTIQHSFMPPLTSNTTT